MFDVTVFPMSSALLQSDLPFPVRRGKVRDVYDLGEMLLIVATDRISAFDCVMPNGIPDKGRILTALSLFLVRQVRWPVFQSPRRDRSWRTTRSACGSSRARSRGGRCSSIRRRWCRSNASLAATWPAPAGRNTRRRQTVCGIALPPGLRQCDKLPAPIFTPATKEESGHDINIDFEETIARIGAPTATELRERTLSLYTQAADYAAGRGVIIADTHSSSSPPAGRFADPGRRGPHPRLQPLLAGRGVRARARSAELRQAVRAYWLERQPWERRRRRRRCRRTWSRGRGGGIWRHMSG